MIMGRRASGPRRATVAGLIGDWPFYYRVLHPVVTALPGDEDLAPTATLRWSEIAAERSETIDPSSATWHSTSGRRLHQTAPDGRDMEPAVGPVPEVLIPLLRFLSLEFDTAEMTVAEWAGYGSVAPGRDLAGGVRRPDRVVGADRFEVWQLSVADLVRAIGAGSESKTMGSGAVLANCVEDPDRRWVVRSDGDLASTYVGTVRPLADWPTDLEWTAAEADSPLG